MTWLRGQTTWSGLIDKINSLACGEAADDFSVTAPLADRWVRDTAGQDCIRPPDSTAVALGPLPNRIGYWNPTCFRAQPGNQSDDVIAATVTSTLRQTAIATALSAQRMHVEITVNTANTVPGNYSNALLVCDVRNADGGGFVNNFNLNPDAAGNVINNSYFGTARVADPSGILQVGTKWVRSFTPTYLGGIDWLGPMLWRRLAAPTFPTPPPGVQNTDWAYTEGISVLTSIGSAGVPHKGSCLQGVGVLTNAALTGALYTYSYAAAQTKIRLFSTVPGQIQMAQGGWQRDLGAGAYLHWGMNTIYPTWLRTHATSGSVTPTSAVQYWLSVKGGTLKIILNADPGQTGKSTCNWVTPIVTPYLSALDTFRWCWGDNANDFAVSFNGSGNTWRVITGLSLYQQLKRTDGSEGRDYQTGWGRTDCYTTQSLGGISTGSDGMRQWLDSTGAGRSLNMVGMYGDRNNSGGQSATGNEVLPANVTKPSPLDGKWWLGELVVSEVLTDGSGSSSFTGDNRNTAQSNGPRGSMNDKVLFLPGTGWISGDEITETATGRTWFCIGADFHGLGSRVMTANGVYSGGVAVLEE